VSELYKSAVVTEEYLINGNKYWCEHCSRYNEARRNVRYETLPRLLTLQLKRFSSTFGYVGLETLNSERRQAPRLLPRADLNLGSPSNGAAPLSQLSLYVSLT